ncbi:neural proliferation differentiation and control protein 1a isoform X2 [Tachysurus fulvidraco]|uniref:neural proliferation differentiation and control protein 1a isoform X2 n=1 Tax=Tachysurus fulvidraco TaxID=1234273 RepID=UPI001FF02E7D|nr:neural proliferation differentiation and control protein 1a isoform X2 [Tachysurus fulvidraco]
MLFILLGGFLTAVSISISDASFTDLDEQIDFLSSVIAKQQVSDVRVSDPPKPKSQSMPKSAYSNLSTVKPDTHSPFTPTQQTFKPPVAQTKAPGHGKHVGTTFPEDGLIVRYRKRAIWLRKRTILHCMRWEAATLTATCRGTRSWLTALRCITTNIRNNKCSRWKNTKSNLKSLNLELRRTRKPKKETSLYTSVPDSHRLERWK